MQGDHYWMSSDSVSEMVRSWYTLSWLILFTWTVQVSNWPHPPGYKVDKVLPLGRLNLDLMCAKHSSWWIGPCRTWQGHRSHPFTGLWQIKLKTHSSLFFSFFTSVDNIQPYCPPRKSQAGSTNTGRACGGVYFRFLRITGKNQLLVWDCCDMIQLFVCHWLTVSVICSISLYHMYDIGYTLLFLCFGMKPISLWRVLDRRSLLSTIWTTLSL